MPEGLLNRVFHQRLLGDALRERGRSALTEEDVLAILVAPWSQLCWAGEVFELEAGLMADAAETLGMMTLECRLVGELRRFLPDGERGAGPVEVPGASTVEDLLVQLELPERETLVVGVNGTKAGYGDVLADGDEVTIVAAMTGGVG